MRRWTNSEFIMVSIYFIKSHFTLKMYDFVHHDFNHLFTIILPCAVLRGVFVANSLQFHILVQTEERVAFN